FAIRMLGTAWAYVMVASFWRPTSRAQARAVDYPDTYRIRHSVSQRQEGAPTNTPRSAAAVGSSPTPHLMLPVKNARGGASSSRDTTPRRHTTSKQRRTAPIVITAPVTARTHASTLQHSQQQHPQLLLPTAQQ